MMDSVSEGVAMASRNRSSSTSSGSGEGGEGDSRPGGKSSEARESPPPEMG